jgi:peptide/nickel transport system substrate-binding protein
VLHATGDRYPNDSAVAQAIAQMWTRIGIKAEVEALPGAVFFTRASNRSSARSPRSMAPRTRSNRPARAQRTYDSGEGFGGPPTARATRNSRGRQLC